MERQEAERILRSAPGYAAYMERREAEEKMPSSRPPSPQQVKTEPEAEPAAAKRRRSTQATPDPLVHQMEDQMDEALGFLGNLDRCGRIRLCCPLRHIMTSNCVWTAAACLRLRNRWTRRRRRGGIQVTMMSRWLEK